MSTKIISAVLMDEHSTLTYIEVCEQYHIPAEVMQEMFEHGFFGQSHQALTSLHFDRATLQRLQSAHRLRQDLNINTPGVILALELLDELEKMRHELAILQRYIQD